MFWGKLASINLYGCDSELIKSKKHIKKFIVELCKLIDMKRYGRCLIKSFGKGNLKGTSALQFIETSSITVHNDETENRVFVDIFSCKDFDENKAEQFSKKFFKATHSGKKVLIRK